MKIASSVHCSGLLILSSILFISSKQNKYSLLRLSPAIKQRQLLKHFMSKLTIKCILYKTTQAFIAM